MIPEGRLEGYLTIAGSGRGEHCTLRRVDLGELVEELREARRALKVLHAVWVSHDFEGVDSREAERGAEYLHEVLKEGRDDN